MTQRTHIPGIRRLVRLATRQAPSEQDVDEEIDFHLAATVDRLVAEGLSPDAARLEALRRFGDIHRARSNIGTRRERRDVRHRRPVAPAAAGELQSLAPDLPYAELRTLGALVEPQLHPWRLGATMFSVFGLVALAVLASLAPALRAAKVDPNVVLRQDG